MGEHCTNRPLADAQQASPYRHRQEAREQAQVEVELGAVIEKIARKFREMDGLHAG